MVKVRKVKVRERKKAKNDYYDEKNENWYFN